MAPVTQVLKDAGISKEDVDQIILVGGSVRIYFLTLLKCLSSIYLTRFFAFQTRIPRVQAMLPEYFNGKKLNKSILEVWIFIFMKLI